MVRLDAQAQFHRSRSTGRSKVGWFPLMIRSRSRAMSTGSLQHSGSRLKELVLTWQAATSWPFVRNFHSKCDGIHGTKCHRYQADPHGTMQPANIGRSGNHWQRIDFAVHNRSEMKAPFESIPNNYYGILIPNIENTLLKKSLTIQHAVHSGLPKALN